MSVKYRDRDFLLTNEKIIFRVYGYCHPDNACICDVEYAPNNIYHSNDPRAKRGNNEYFKFYFDGGLKFIQKKYPRYQVFYKPLNVKLVGLKYDQISEVRKPDEKLQSILKRDANNELIYALQELMDIIKQHSNLKPTDFGVFGSILHDFYHTKFSDIDLTIYGRKELEILREVLQELYHKNNSYLKNEFEFPSAETFQKNWRYINYSLQEYIRNNVNKQIYAIMDSKKAGREIKVEFEPVKKWDEIENEYNDIERIVPIDWIKAKAIVIDDKDSFFMQSIYKIHVEEIISGPKIDNITRIVNYLEEFRGQAKNDDKLLVEGHLEKVITKKTDFYQVTLSYASRYHEQTLKKI